MSAGELDELKRTTVKAVETCGACGKRVRQSNGESGVELVDPTACCLCGENGNPEPESDTAKENPQNNLPDLGERYDVLNRIGTGGMGSVYRVKDKALDKEFAVKVMRHDLVQDKVSVKRFEQEAQAASSLTHANLAAVYGYGVAKNGSPYLVMDYLHGQTLEDVLKKEGFLDVPRALDIFTQAADAVANAHMKNIIHRDIKPSNIILEKNDNGIDMVKVVDFGIAKVLPSQQKAYENLTQTGDIFGSPLYMSPEQCQGNMQDRRSDIYSLGCVMYEALTGMQPYAAENPIKIILKHINDDPKPINSLPNDYKIPPDLDTVIMHCLEREPGDRYQSADELAIDLRRIADGFKIHLKPKTRKKQLPHPQPKTVIWPNLLVAALTVLAITIIGSASIVWLYHPAVTGSHSAFTDAQELDNRSFEYFKTGQYDKAAPLLEFGVPTYKEMIAQDRARGDSQAALRDETLLAENWQHIGKCHLKLALHATHHSNKLVAKEEYSKAYKAYREAMPFYYQHGNWQGGSTPEAVQDFAKVLVALDLTDELNRLKAFATRWNISI